MTSCLVLVDVVNHTLQQCLRYNSPRRIYKLQFSRVSECLRLFEAGFKFGRRAGSGPRDSVTRIALPVPFIQLITLRRPHFKLIEKHTNFALEVRGNSRPSRASKPSWHFYTRIRIARHFSLWFRFALILLRWSRTRRPVRTPSVMFKKRCIRSR